MLYLSTLLGRVILFWQCCKVFYWNFFRENSWNALDVCYKKWRKMLPKLVFVYFSKNWSQNLRLRIVTHFCFSWWFWVTLPGCILSSFWRSFWSMNTYFMVCMGRGDPYLDILFFKKKLVSMWKFHFFIKWKLVFNFTMKVIALEKKYFMLYTALISQLLESIAISC